MMNSVSQPCPKIIGKITLLLVVVIVIFALQQNSVSSFESPRRPIDDNISDVKNETLGVRCLYPTFFVADY
jgi:hypothetical protein